MSLLKLFLIALLVCVLTLVIVGACGNGDDEDERASAADDDDDYSPPSNEDDDSDDDDSNGTFACANGLCSDPSTGLMWQAESNCCHEWDEAKSYCNNLILGLYDDWRLPSISELRSLIRGCKDTITGGTCGVADSCHESSCWNDSCQGCNASADCYYPSQLNDECNWKYWSSSEVSDDIFIWVILFNNASVGKEGLEYHQNVRCVRNQE